MSNVDMKEADERRMHCAERVEQLEKENAELNQRLDNANTLNTTLIDSFAVVVKKSQETIAELEEENASLKLLAK